MTTPTLLKNIAFTDTAGATFTAATFQVDEANLSANENENFKLNFDDFSTASLTTNNNSNVHCSFAYWVSESERTSGTNTPYWLANVQSRTPYFNFNPNNPVYEGLTLEAKCLKYLEDEILPSLLTPV